LAAKFDIVAFGFPDYELREAARDAKEHAGALAFLSARYRLSAGSFALEKQAATPVAALDKNFTWRGEGNCVGVCQRILSATSKSDDAANPYSIRPSFWLPKEWDLALNRRRSALFLNRGYPLTLDEELVFTLPAKSRVVGLPSPTGGAIGSFHWRLEWGKSDDSRITATLHTEVSTGELSVEQTSLFQRELRALVAAVNGGFTVELPSP
jgi:hypothetical protein